MTSLCHTLHHILVGVEEQRVAIYKTSFWKLHLKNTNRIITKHAVNVYAIFQDFTSRGSLTSIADAGENIWVQNKILEITQLPVRRSQWIGLFKQNKGTRLYTQMSCSTFEVQLHYMDLLIPVSLYLNGKTLFVSIIYFNTCLFSVAFNKIAIWTY